MIEWLVSDYIEGNLPVVGQWFNSKSYKNNAFRKLQMRFQSKLDMIRAGGPDLLVNAIAGSSISAHIDKIQVKGRLSISVLFCRGPKETEITLLGASIEQDSKLTEPGLEKHAKERYSQLATGNGRRQPYEDYP